MKNKSKHYSNYVWGILVVALMSMSANSYAARYALLVGIGNYPRAELEGPINDVAALQQVLKEKWGFEAKNTRTLVNEEGTKKNILLEMNRLTKLSKKGDEIFLYFSGHGTSAQDRSLQFPLPTTSGALIPYDVRNAKTVKEILKTLLVGKTDLRPILMELDQGGRHVFVAIDACYSGNAVRGIMKNKAARLPARFMSLNTLLPGRAFGDDLINTGSEVWENKPTDTEKAYPYKNIYYLSASGEHEQAKDIPFRLLTKIPTIDGKAHGAFTDTLLRVLNKPASADLNKNGEVTYAEITKTVRKRMRRRGFDHTPNGLPSIAEDSTSLASRGIFRNANLIAVSQKEKQSNTDAPIKTASNNTKALKKSVADEERLRLRVGSGLEKWRDRLDKLSRVDVVKADSDVTVRQIGEEILLISAAGDVIVRSKKTDLKTISKLVEHQAVVHRLVNKSMIQDFNVNLEIYGNGKGSVAVKGETVGFSITTERDAYLLLVDIDPAGNINVIYPFYNKELQPITARKPFIRKDIAIVGTPYGRDFVQVYAFEKLSAELKQMVGVSIPMDSPKRAIFERLIGNHSLSKARASLELITTERQ